MILMEVSSLRRQSFGLLGGYVLQFLAGMLVNLFVTIPSNHPGSNPSNYFSGGLHGLGWVLAGHGGWELVFHVYLAVLLVFGSICLFVRALVQHDNNWTIAGGAAALFTLGAFFNGLSFITYNHNINSMIMATCWLLAVGSLLFALFRFPVPAKHKHAANKI